MGDVIQSSYRAEDEEDLGEESDSGGESDDSPAPSPRRQLFGLPASTRFNSKSPLYDFSSLTRKLPDKKGLSRYYKGKSQSFTSLSEVKSLEDLSKREEEVPYTRKIKPCKSYVELDQAQMAAASSSETCGGKSMTKKTPPSLASCASSMARSSSAGFLSCESRPPSIPVHKLPLNRY